MPASTPRHLQLSRPTLSRRAVIAALLTLLLTVLVVVWAGHRGGDDTPAEPMSPTDPGSVAPAELTGVARDAQTMLTTWARPGTPYQQWWRALSPMLSPAAKQAYADTDTSKLPELGELREPSIDSDYGPDSAAVWFTTDQGRFGVDVARAGAGQPWRMVRVLFPGQKSSFA